MGKLNLNGTKNYKEGNRPVEVFKGSFEDMTKIKAKKTPEILQEVEKLFEKYNGGSFAIVINEYDENGDVDNTSVAIMGVDKAQGLLTLSKALQSASEEIIENLTSQQDPRVLSMIMTDMLRDLFNDIKDIHDEKS